MAKRSLVPDRRRSRTFAHGEMRIVVCRCLVCEWQDELIARSDEIVDCPWCYGPAQRLRVLGAVQDRRAPGKTPHAAALGRLGGLKGGAARAAALTAEKRSEIAVKAARARWKRRKKTSE